MSRGEVVVTGRCAPLSPGVRRFVDEYLNTPVGGWRGGLERDLAEFPGNLAGGYADVHEEGGVGVIVTKISLDMPIVSQAHITYVSAAIIRNIRESAVMDDRTWRNAKAAVLAKLGEEISDLARYTDSVIMSLLESGEPPALPEIAAEITTLHPDVLSGVFETALCADAVRWHWQTTPDG